MKKENQQINKEIAEREQYLKRQSYADRFYSDSRRAEFRNNFNERDLFLEFIDEAKSDGTKEYQKIIVEKAKKAESWQEFQSFLIHTK